MKNSEEKEIVEIAKFSKKSMVVKGNPLVQAKFDELTAIEYKIIIAALSKISPNDKVLDTIYFKAKDFCNLLKIQSDGMYSYIKEACDKLMKRTITIEISGKRWVKFSWIHRIEYNSGLIMLNFHPELEPYLLFWKKNSSYTKYFLENVIDMERKYSIRLYEITKQYEKIGYRTFLIDELKQLLGIPLKKYLKTTHLKRDVLLPSVDEVNGLTDININFELIKDGRKTAKIKYLIKAKDFNINSNEYELMPKLKLVSELRKRINKTTGTILEISLLKKYHRIVLIEMIKKFDTGMFSKIIIKHPKAFFKWHLDDTDKMFDLSNVEDY